MLGPYIAALLFGGLLLAISLLAGGGDDHADADAHGDAGGDHDAAGDHADAMGAFVSTFASLRFWTFFAAFGGGTGTVLTLLSLPAVVVAIAAAAMGAVSGAFAVWTFRLLGQRQLSSALTSEDWLGRSAKVVVPVSATRRGKVRLELEDEVKEMVAIATEAGDELAVGEEVLIVSIEDGVARVSSSRPRTVPAGSSQQVVKNGAT